MGAVNVNATPGMPAPVLSTTFAARGYGSQVLTLALKRPSHGGDRCRSSQAHARSPRRSGGPVSVPFEMVAVHRGLGPAEKTSVPVGPAAPVTAAE